MNANRFFSIPYDNRNDVAIRLLRSQGGGLVAYGRWVALLGMLYDSDGIIRLEVPGMVDLLLNELEFADQDELLEYLDTLAGLQLIDAGSLSERNHVINEGVVKEIDYYRAKSEAGKEGNRKRWKKGDNAC